MKPIQQERVLSDSANPPVVGAGDGGNLITTNYTKRSPNGHQSLVIEPLFHLSSDLYRSFLYGQLSPCHLLVRTDQKLRFWSTGIRFDNNASGLT